MRITKISATNLKGRKFSLPLGPANLIVGANMTGKTAVLDAIRLALIGHIPGLNKTNEGIFSMASGSSMSVTAETDGGHQIERAWARAADGSIKKNERLAHGLAATPLVMLDAADFLGRSERDRMEMIFSLLNLAATPLAIRINGIKDRLALGEGNPIAIEVLKAMPQIASDDYQRWLERALQAMADSKRLEMATAKRMTATQQSLAYLALKDEGQARSPEMVRAELTEARAVLEAKREAKAKANAALEAVSQASQRILGLSQRKTKLQKRAIALPALEKAMQAATSDPEQEAERPLSAFIDDAAKQGGRADVSRQLIVQIESRMDDLDDEERTVFESKECPTCSTNKPTWKKNAQVKFDARREKLVAEKAAQKKLLAKAAQEKAAAMAALQEAKLRGEARAAREAERRELEFKLVDAQRAAEELAEVETELQSLGAAPDDTESINKASHIDCEFADALECVNDLEMEQQQIANELADRKRLQEASGEADKARANAKLLDAGMAILEEERTNFMQAGIAPLLKVANVFTASILPTPLEFQHGEIGRTENDRWIPSRAFSGAEQTVTHAAISAALGAQAPIRLVLVDEMGRMDSQHAVLFLTNLLSALASETIDQFIGVDVNATAATKINEANDGAPLRIIPIRA